MQHYADNFIFVVPDDQPLHSAENPFCYDPTCPCHEDESLVADVNAAYQEGIITADDATRIVWGRTI